MFEFNVRVSYVDNEDSQHEQVQADFQRTLFPFLFNEKFMVVIYLYYWFMIRTLSAMEITIGSTDPSRH